MSKMFPLLLNRVQGAGLNLFCLNFYLLRVTLSVFKWIWHTFQLVWVYDYQFWFQFNCAFLSACVRYFRFISAGYQIFKPSRFRNSLCTRRRIISHILLQKRVCFSLALLLLFEIYIGVVIVARGILMNWYSQIRVTSGPKRHCLLVGALVINFVLVVVLGYHLLRL